MPSRVTPWKNELDPSVWRYQIQKVRRGRLAFPRVNGRPTTSPGNGELLPSTFEVDLAPWLRRSTTCRSCRSTLVVINRKVVRARASRWASLTQAVLRGLDKIDKPSGGSLELANDIDGKAAGGGDLRFGPCFHRARCMQSCDLRATAHAMHRKQAIAGRHPSRAAHGYAKQSAFAAYILFARAGATPWRRTASAPTRPSTPRLVSA